MRTSISAILVALSAALCACGILHSPSPPAVTGFPSSAGLHVSTWTFDDDRPFKQGTAAEFDVTLTELAGSQQQIPPEAVVDWNRQGLQLLVVDASQLPALLERIRISGALQQQRLNQLPRWTAIHSGPESILPMILELDDGPIQLDAGEMRLLARAFLVPNAADSDGSLRASMQMEFALQHVATSEGSEEATDSVAGSPESAFHAGTVFTSMDLQAVLNAGQAVLVVPVDQSAQTSGSNPPPEPIVGPLPPRFPRIGEALLTDYSRLPSPTSRTILVIEPLIPKTFSLP